MFLLTNLLCKYKELASEHVPFVAQYLFMQYIIIIRDYGYLFSYINGKLRRDPDRS